MLGAQRILHRQHHPVHQLGQQLALVLDRRDHPAEEAAPVDQHHAGTVLTGAQPLVLVDADRPVRRGDLPVQRPDPAGQIAAGPAELKPQQFQRGVVLGVGRPEQMVRIRPQLPVQLQPVGGELLPGQMGGQRAARVRLPRLPVGAVAQLDGNPVLLDLLRALLQAVQQLVVFVAVLHLENPSFLMRHAARAAARCFPIGALRAPPGEEGRGHGADLTPSLRGCRRSRPARTPRAPAGGRRRRCPPRPSRAQSRSPPSSASSWPAPR